MIFGLCIRNKFLLLYSQWRDYGRDELSHYLCRALRTDLGVLLPTRRKRG